MGVQGRTPSGQPGTSSDQPVVRCRHLCFRDCALEAGFTVTRAGSCEHTGQPPRDHIAELQAPSWQPADPEAEPQPRRHSDSDWASFLGNALKNRKPASIMKGEGRIARRSGCEKRGRTDGPT